MYILGIRRPVESSLFPPCRSEFGTRIMARLPSDITNPLPHAIPRWLPYPSPLLNRLLMNVNSPTYVQSTTL
jgi:hypothetical protein